MMIKCIKLLVWLMVVSAACGAPSRSPSAQVAVVVRPADAPANVKLAAKEVRRYVWLRTGTLLPIVAAPGSGTPAIKLKTDAALDAQQYRLKTESGSLTISGGSDVSVLYGAYALAENLSFPRPPYRGKLNHTTTHRVRIACQLPSAPFPSL